MTGTRAHEVLRRMRSLPMADLDTIAPGTSLILAPHPDDETLGCGGLIIGCCERHRPPLIVAVTDGSRSHRSAAWPPDRLATLRAGELRAAAGILGVAAERVRFLGLTDSQAPFDGPDFDRAVQNVTALVQRHSVRTVFATWPHDPHGDHKATARIAAAVAAGVGVRLRFYPVWGWLLPDDAVLPIDEVRGARLDVSADRAQKRRALAAHASQYSGLIADDPQGFRLPSELLAVTERDEEVFLEP